MGGNFPAGKREERDRREKPPIFDTRKRPGKRIKGRREPVRTLKYPFVIKNKNYY